MGRSIRAIVFNGDETYAAELRQALLSLPELRIVAELDEPSLLPHAAAQFPAEVLILHLDPAAPLVLEVAGQVLAANPRVPVIAISGCTDGDTLLKAMRIGLKRFLVKPLDLAELKEAVGQIAGEQAQAREPGKLVSVLGSAGGVGATFLATNLAVELAELTGAAGRVALLDFDFRFGQVATVLDLESQFTISDLCSTPEQVDPAMIEKALVKHASGVWVLARPQQFAQAEGITAAHCAGVLTVMQEMFTYIVIDGPMRSDPGGRIILDAADFNLMIVQLLVTSVRNTARMMEELATQGFSASRMRFVCNRLGRDSGHLETAQVERTLGAPFFHTLPDEWKSASASINVGQPLRTEFSKSKLCQSVRELAMKIHCPDKVTEAGKSAGLLSRFLKPRGRETAPPPVAPAAAGA
ncbi:MAG: hypothetical protein U1A27_04420 [Phycisphaerae bacterium]